eukprot:TRINITY_DN72263_c0_g1_i1.p1 TRINITY_DN72263_c0_g1~~TRINITY_DN72263_c0_g1_i1.p1  ORF type:complete len:159 (-),score=19.32 TRINITY_DN72263_c0_g1_i1:43-519(-)
MADAPSSAEAAKHEAFLCDMLNEKAPIARALGFRLRFEPGAAVVELPYNPHLDQAHKGIHGGIYGVLADTAGWFCSARSRPPGTWPLTAELHTHYFRAAAKSGLTARATILHASLRQDVVRIDLTDDKGRSCAHMIGTFTIPDGAKADAATKPPASKL